MLVVPVADISGAPSVRRDGLRDLRVVQEAIGISGCAGLIQAVIFEVNDRDLIGYPTPTGYRYCCTKELVPKTKCFQDRLIYQACSPPVNLSDSYVCFSLQALEATQYESAA